jgi:acyl-CoA synthetase (NDP forming)
MCAIIVIPKIANSEIVQKDLPKAVESVVKIAQNYLEELADIKKEDEQ